LSVLVVVGAADADELVEPGRLGTVPVGAVPDESHPIAATHINAANAVVVDLNPIPPPCHRWRD
jgi:hypothetical protein